MNTDNRILHCISCRVNDCPGEFTERQAVFALGAFVVLAYRDGRQAGQGLLNPK